MLNYSPDYLSTFRRMFHPDRAAWEPLLPMQEGNSQPFLLTRGRPSAQPTEQPINSIVAMLQHHVETQPDATLFRILNGTDETATGEREEIALTYRQLSERARVIAAQLQQVGGRGERVLLLYPFGADFIAAFLGCLYAGAIAVPLFPPRQNRVDERLLAVATDAQAGLALTTEKIAQSLDTRKAPAATIHTMHWLPTPDFSTWSAVELTAAAAGWQSHLPHPETLAFLQYTSGSTGLPKGVMVSHENLMHNTDLIAQCFALSTESRGLMWTPFYHDMGLIGGLMVPIRVGFETHLMNPVAFLQRPARWLQAISTSGATISGGPNFAYELCVDKVTPEQCEGLDLSTWSVAFSGAEPVRSATLARFAQKFAPYGFYESALTPCYGLAESTLFVSGTPAAQLPQTLTVDAQALTQNRAEIVGDLSTDTDQPTHTLVSSGRAWHDHRCWIIDPVSLAPLSDGMVGEIWISGPSTAQGYWNRRGTSTATFAAQTPTLDGTFLRSGDLGFVHDGELFVTGRLKDLIIIRGKNHYPQDLEYTIERAHPALREGCGAVFTVDGADETERLVVVQEIERTHLRNLPVNEVIRAIRRAVSQHHALELHTIVLLRPGRILKTTSGKIQRRAIKQAFLTDALTVEHRWSAQPNGGNPAQRTHESTAATLDLPADATVAMWLVQQLAHRLQLDPATLDLDQPFADYGLDSLAAVELVEQLRLWLAKRNVPLALDPTMLWDYPTINALATHLEAERTRVTALHTHEPAGVDPLVVTPATDPSTVAQGAPNNVAVHDELLAELKKLEELLLL